MTQVNFSLNIDELKEKVMDSKLDDVLKSALVMVLNEIMLKEQEEYLKASQYERNDLRTDYRNGFYESGYMIGSFELRLLVPRTRNGEFEPSVFERYERRDQALVLSMLEMVVNGVSTRKVGKIVEELCGKSVSKSFVSNLTKKLDPIVKEWLNRPLNVTYYPYIYADAMYIKVREDNKVVSKAVYIVVGVNKQNKREIIGMEINHVESKDAWLKVFENLKSRGLQSPKLLISDAHAGLKASVPEAFVGTSWQRCTFHLKKDLIEKMPKKNVKEIKHEMNLIYETVDPDIARKRKNQFIEKYEDKHPKVCRCLEDGFEDSIQYMSEPTDYHIHLRTTNNLERINQEVRRREQVIRIFPNTQSAVRLIGAVLMDVDENLDLKRRYLPKKKISN
ncbi:MULTISPECIES: IS256 family transposase [Allobacillus]|uniref:Mutator family transposase n=1 Tax=Allobacillus salarius TaxID=1955272 RepID=A0A556PP85_9BACI|nr:IS256 family transposase [Allobacillus salarius]TSJ66207.1 IS256 family transposase [Allobacillus salarius]